MTRIFISYSSHNLKAAERLHQRLEALGYDVWRDRTRIKGGASWPQAIQDGLESADAVVVLWSEKAAGSDWVGREITYSANRKKPVIPLLLDDHSLSLLLTTYQAIDTRPKWNAAMDRLNTALVDILGTKPEPALEVEKETMTHPSPDQKSSNRTQIVVAIIGVIGSVVVALIGLFAVLIDNRNDPTPTPSTPPPTLTSTPTPLTPTPASTPTPAGTTATTAPTLTVTLPVGTPTTANTPTLAPTLNANVSPVDAVFNLDALNAWRSMIQASGTTCPPLTESDVLASIAREHIGHLQTYSFPQLTAEPGLAVRTSSGLSLPDFADLRGYTGEIQARVLITSADTPPLVRDVLDDGSAATCGYPEIGIASLETRGSNALYLVVIFGSG